MNFEYKYITPESQGLTKIKVTKENHNKVFTYRKRTFFKSLIWKYEYFADDKKIRVENVPTFLAKVLVILLFPLHLIIYGTSNYKDVISDTKKLLNARKYGSFASDTVEGDLYFKLKGTK